MKIKSRKFGDKYLVRITQVNYDKWEYSVRKGEED